MTTTQKTSLQAGDLATGPGLRVAHIIRRVDGSIARTLCTEIALWSALEADDGRVSRLAEPDSRVCKTCGGRAEARARRVKRQSGRWAESKAAEATGDNALNEPAGKVV